MKSNKFDDELLGAQVYGPNKKAHFYEVVNAVIAERVFQDEKWGKVDDNPHEIGVWLLLIEAELQEAKMALIKGGKDRNSLRAEIIQVAALCIAALEQHGLVGNKEGREI